MRSSTASPAPSGPRTSDRGIGRVIQLCGVGGGSGGDDGRPGGDDGVEGPVNAGHAPETGGGIGEAPRWTDGGGAGGTALAGFAARGRVAPRGGGAVPRASGCRRGQREKR